MFEKEIEEIKERYNNSIEITNKLKELYKNYEYGGSERTNIFYLDIHINETAESIKKHAFDAINQIIKYNGIKTIKEVYYYDRNNITLEEKYKELEAITIQDFYNSYFIYEEYAKKRTNKTDYTILNDSKMIFENPDNREDDLFLILNCIWLLVDNHTELISWELKSKIRNIIKENNTFIFCGCKVTFYKNGKLNIQFSDKDIYNSFKNHSIEALQNATEYYNKSELAKGA